MWPKRVLYRGVWMRSQLEVTWAQFLETREIAWQYEPVSFWRYRPDFALDGQRRIFLEVKGHRVALNRFGSCPFPLIIAWGAPSSCEIGFKDLGAPGFVTVANFDSALNRARTRMEHPELALLEIAAREYLPYKESE